MNKFLLSIFLFSSLVIFSQTRGIDSLKLRLKKETAKDTMRVTDLNELGWQFLDYSSDSAQKYVQQALELSKEIDYPEGVIQAKNAQGILYRYNNEPEKAIALYNEIINLRTKQGRFDKLTGAYSNLGSVFYERGDNASALLYYKKALENAARFDQKDNQMILLNNLGSAYKSSGFSDLAIETFKKGLELNKERRDEQQEATFYINIGTVYDQQRLFKESIKYCSYAYKIFKRSGNIRQLSVVLYNLSVTTRQIKDFAATDSLLKEMEKVAELLKEDDYYASFYQSRANYYIAKNKFPEALKDATFSLRLTDTINDISGYCARLRIKSEIYLQTHDLEKAIYFCNLEKTLLHKVDDKHELVNNYRLKAEIYERMNDYKSALTHYSYAESLQDSLNTDAFNTKMAVLNSLNELDRKETQLQLSQKETETMAAKNKQQTAFLTGSLIIAFLVLVLLVFSIRAYRVKKKDNELLNSQKQEIQVKNIALQERQVEIENQKLLVEEKQKEILDSIHYAQRIQKTLLANHELISRNLPGHFILFKPKDIVSGDFYWATEKHNCFYLAVCDSTGHGVPGAFMSLLNISFLNEAINEKNIREPHEVLNHVRQKLIGSISQEGAQDGMDCILLCFNKENNTISYAAAQNKLLLIRGNERFEYPADKMPVGKGESMDSFTLHQVDARKGDQIYLYSDGYADQFGGPRGKKFKYKALQEHLQANAGLPLEEQAKRMDAAFESWRGALEQVDDVVLIGIRL